MFGAKVDIQGQNIQPNWGLYNGCIGTVKEIIFGVGKNPNHGHLPLYVAVEFPSYNPPKTVPLFDKLNPQIVPIPMITKLCKHGCCHICFCPLILEAEAPI